MVEGRIVKYKYLQYEDLKDEYIKSDPKDKKKLCDIKCNKYKKQLPKWKR